MTDGAYKGGDCSKLIVKTGLLQTSICLIKKQMFRQTLIFLASLAEHFKKITTFAKMLERYG